MSMGTPLCSFVSLIGHFGLCMWGEHVLQDGGGGGSCGLHEVLSHFADI